MSISGVSQAIAHLSPAAAANKPQSTQAAQTMNPVAPAAAPRAADADGDRDGSGGSRINVKA